MKRASAFAFCILPCAFLQAAEPVAPTSFPPARYQDLIKKSPFAPATTTTAPVDKGFATNYYVAGVAKIGAKDLVTIVSKNDQSRSSMMPGDPPNVDGITIAEIKWSDETGKSKVILKKGNETGVAEFDQMALQKAPPPVPPVSGVPAINPPRPTVQRLPLPTMKTAPPPPPTNIPLPGETRRRIRIINSPPQ